MGRTTRKTKHLQPGQPPRPSNLSPRAAQEWDRITGELESAGIKMTPAHRPALSQAATIAADIADCWHVVSKEGAYITTKAGLVAHPAVKRLDALRRDFIKVLTMLGIRAAVAEPDPGDGPGLGELLGG